MEYTQVAIKSAIDAQRRFFSGGSTLDIDFRLSALKKLKASIIKYESELEEALLADIGKSPTESYLCDIGPSIAEINEMIHGLKRWTKPEIHYSGIMCFPSLVTKVYKTPYGVTLIISPFNFPVLLTVGALAAAISGGNTAIIKTSSKSAHTTACLIKMISETFPPEYITVIGGGHDVADMCLAERFDKIFYTGSPAVAKHVLASAAQHLTPTALELGGETGNWCIVRKDADIKDAAHKIAFMKICNAGQVCININQIAVAREIADGFLAELTRAIGAQLGEHPENNEEYPRLISPSAFDKCLSAVNEYRDRIVYGGTYCAQSLRFSPTVIYPVSAEEDIVQHELFSPILPVVPFDDRNIEALLDTISAREHPLAMYIFTKDIKWAENTMRRMQFGGGCINEVCLQLMVKGVPFNGTGHSGMGAYHGVWGLREFTHPTTVLKGSTRFNLHLREHPYGRFTMKLLKLLIR